MYMYMCTCILHAGKVIEEDTGHVHEQVPIDIGLLYRGWGALGFPTPQSNTVLLTTVLLSHPMQHHQVLPQSTCLIVPY